MDSPSSVLQYSHVRAKLCSSHQSEHTQRVLARFVAKLRNHSEILNLGDGTSVYAVTCIFSESPKNWQAGSTGNCRSTWWMPVTARSKAFRGYPDGHSSTHIILCLPLTDLPHNAGNARMQMVRLRRIQEAILFNPACCFVSPY